MLYEPVVLVSVRIEILFLSFSAVSIKNRCTAFYSDTVNSVIFINRNVNTFCYCLFDRRKQLLQ